MKVCLQEMQQFYQFVRMEKNKIVLVCKIFSVLLHNYVHVSQPEKSVIM